MRLLPLLAAALCCWAAAVRADTYTVVWSPEDLLRALALAAASPLNQSVIELPRNILLQSSDADAYELPLRISGRLTLRRGEYAAGRSCSVCFTSLSCQRVGSASADPAFGRQLSNR